MATKSSNNAAQNTGIPSVEAGNTKSKAAPSVTFECPQCGYKQKGYFNTCPTPDCARLTLAAFVAEMEQRCAVRVGGISVSPRKLKRLIRTAKARA